MIEISKTMYIPLFGKALVSQKGVILSDKKAEEIWNGIKFDKNDIEEIISVSGPWWASSLTSFKSFVIRDINLPVSLES